MKMSEKEAIQYFLDNNFDDNYFNSDGSLNKKYNNKKKTGLIARIFEEHWSTFYEEHKELIDKYRHNANDEIKKIIDCYNKDLGCSAYVCPECNEAVFISHTCKSRMCSSCGYKYKMSRVENILQTAYRCKHRQIVFTIPEYLRKYFFYPFEEMIHLLFLAVNLTIQSIFNNSFKMTKKVYVKNQMDSWFLCFSSYFW